MSVVGRFLDAPSTSYWDIIFIISYIVQIYTLKDPLILAGLFLQITQDLTSGYHVYVGSILEE